MGSLAQSVSAESKCNGVKGRPGAAVGRQRSATKANSKKMLPNGRGSQSPQFLMALHAIFDHPDYQTMSKQTRAFLWDFARQYNGHNNGNLSAAVGVMGKYGWSRRELSRARKEAQACGWIAPTRMPRAKREPILYRLTWRDLDRWDGRPYLDAELTDNVHRRSLRA